MADSRIEWTDKVWNPTTGCTKGCSYCYARIMAGRLQKMGQEKYIGGFAPACHPGELEKPLCWRKPCRVFVNSMGDLFDPAIPFEFIDQILVVIACCPQHTFQILTKFPERVLEYSTDRLLPPNLWVGVTVEDQAAADARLPFLLRTPAAVRFVSIEPMTGPVELPRIKRTLVKPSNHFPGVEFAGDGGYPLGVDWVICGGMTGKDAVPMHPDWVRTLRDQCKAADVPFFFKGWGEWRPRIAAWEPKPFGIFLDGSYYRAGLLMGPINAEAIAITERHSRQQYAMIHRVGKKAAGSRIDGQEWKQLPEGL